MSGLPTTTTLQLQPQGAVLRVVLHRPERRNAMSATMVGELMAVFRAATADPALRVVVLQGTGGHFCAGGDLADMAGAAAAAPVDGVDAIAHMNRQFGAMLQQVDASPMAVVALCEGAVMGGGFGLACVADVTIAVEGARFRLPETSLGLIPAQIAPFIVQRLGLSHARRLAVTGQTLDAAAATALGLAHHHAADRAAGEAQLGRTLAAILRCEPGAVAQTKALMQQVSSLNIGPALDQAALDFAALARGDTAQQGFAAFLSRSPAPWVQEP